MTDRTESCTPEERRFLDRMNQCIITNADATMGGARIAFEFPRMEAGASGHQLVNDLYAARGDKD